MGKRLNLNALHGMIEYLPRDHAKWTTERRREFLETFAVVLDYVHPAPVTPIPVDKSVGREAQG